jgi:hypothetical protein
MRVMTMIGQSKAQSGTQKSGFQKMGFHPSSSPYEALR